MKLPRSYAITRIVTAAGGQGMMIIPFTLIMEYSGVRERVPLLPWVTWSALLANIINVPFALGEALPPLVAMVLTDWVEYQAAISSLILGGDQSLYSSINIDKVGSKIQTLDFKKSKYWALEFYASICIKTERDI